MNEYSEKLKYYSMLLGMLAATALAGLAIMQFSPLIVLGMVAGLAVFLVCFFSTEAALYILLFSMLLSPEIPVVKLATDTAEGREALTIRVEDLLLVIMLLSYLAKMALYKALGFFLRTPLNPPIFLYAAACVFSTGLGALLGHVKLASGMLYVAKYIEYFIVYFMVVNHLKTREQIRRFTFVFLLTGGIVCLYAVAHIGIMARVSTPFETEPEGAANTLGGYLVFLLGMSATLLMNLKERKYRWLLGLLVVLIIPPLMYAKSRGAWLSVVPVYLTLLIFSRHRAKLVAVAVVLFFIWPLVVPRDIVERMRQTFEPDYQSVSVGAAQLDFSTSERIRGYINAVKALPNRPVFGYGITGFKFLDGMYFKTLIELGLVGLFIFFYLLWAIFRVGYANFRLSRGDPLLEGVSLGFLAGYLGLLVNAIPLNTFIIIRIMEPFWFFAGVVVMIPEILRLEAAASQESPPPPAGGEPSPDQGQPVARAATNAALARRLPISFTRR